MLTTTQLTTLLKQRHDGSIWQVGIDIAIEENRQQDALEQLTSQYHDNPELMESILPKQICKQLFT
jgi:hypothetical protein